MRVFVNMDCLPAEMRAPALIGRPEAGIPLGVFNQLTSELEIVAKMETFPIGGLDTKNYSGTKVREIKVAYEPDSAGGFSYGIRDYIITTDKELVRVAVPRNQSHLGTHAVAVAEGSYTSLNIWEGWVPKEFVAELYSFER